MSISSGKNITSAFRIAKGVGKELDSLYESIGHLVDDYLSEELYKSGRIKYDGIVEGKYSINGSDWIQSEFISNYKLYKPYSRSNHFAQIAFHCILIPDYRFPHLEEPLLSICYSTHSEWSDFQWSWDENDDDELQISANGKLMTWDRDENSEWKEGEWAFSLPLISLTSVDDIKNQIFTPILNILSGQVDNAFPENSPVISFKISEKEEKSFIPRDIDE